MATYRIRGVYEYEGVVEAPTAEGAEALFLYDLNTHYVGTEEFEKVLVCPICEDEIESEDELNDDSECESCAEEDEDE